MHPYHTQFLILSAYLHLAMPTNGYTSSSATETYRVQDVTTSTSILLCFYVT